MHLEPPPDLSVGRFGWPSIYLVGVWLALLRATRYYGGAVALFGLVGTTGHEALHLLIGLMLGARPTSFSILPRRQGDSWVLGSVGFTHLTIWNSAPVAYAPLLLAGIGWLVIRLWMQPAFLAGSYVSWAVAGYVAACCFFSCIPSTTDVKVGFLSSVLYGALGYGLWRVGQ